LGHVKKIEFSISSKKNIIHLLNTKLNEHSIVASVESASRGKKLNELKIQNSIILNFLERSIWIREQKMQINVLFSLMFV